MKTVNVYEFTELNAEAQQRVIENYTPNTDAEFQDHRNTLEAFRKLTNWMKRESFFDDENFTGVRLSKFLWNNLGREIYRGKFYNSIEGRHAHKNVKLFTNHKGEVSSFYYSSILLEYSCPLTGVYCDHSILDPIVKAMNEPANLTLEELFTVCEMELQKSLEDAVNDRWTDESKTQDLLILEDVYYTEEGRQI